MTEHQIQPVKGLIYECEYPERPGLKGTLITAMILPVPRRKEVLETKNGYFLYVFGVNPKSKLCKLKLVTGDPDLFCPVDDLIGPLHEFIYDEVKWVKNRTGGTSMLIKT